MLITGAKDFAHARDRPVEEAGENVGLVRVEEARTSADMRRSISSVGENMPSNT